MYVTTNSSWLEHVWTSCRPDDDPNEGVETCCQTNKSIKRRPVWLQYSCVLWLSHTFNINTEWIWHITCNCPAYQAVTIQTHNILRCIPRGTLQTFPLSSRGRNSETVLQKVNFPNSTFSLHHFIDSCPVGLSMHFSIILYCIHIV